MGTKKSIFTIIATTALLFGFDITDERGEVVAKLDEKKFQSCISSIKKNITQTSKLEEAKSREEYQTALKLGIERIDKTIADCQGKPVDFYLYYMRGAINDRLGLPFEAIADYTKSIGLNKKFKWSHLDRGMIYGKSGYFIAAEDDFRKALEILPHWDDAYFSLGVNYEDQGKMKEAKYYYELAIKHQTKYSKFITKAYNNLGNIYNQQEQYARAIKEFDAALKIEPKYTFALVNRYLAKYNMGDKSGACSDLKLAIELGRTDKQLTYDTYCKQ